jgi:hypothetical protein
MKAREKRDDRAGKMFLLMNLNEIASLLWGSQCLSPRKRIGVNLRNKVLIINVKNDNTVVIARSASDAAIQPFCNFLDCFASLAMTARV